MSSSAIIDHLPGLNIPVADIPAKLNEMWYSESSPGHEPPSEFHALQMNLVLHFGLQTSAEEAMRCFEAAINLAQRYPCRVIVLCPGDPEEPETDKLVDGKLFSQCYIGSDHRDMCCCEALMIRYSTTISRFLENQISLWLDSDLPVYYWLHRVPSDRLEEHYATLLKQSRVIVFDSSVEQGEYRETAWPDPDKVRDLAKARTLPFRQSLGQFLSSYAPAILIDDLTQVNLRHRAEFAFEARHFRDWMGGAINHCLETENEQKSISYAMQVVEGDSPYSLQVQWDYSNEKYLEWSYLASSNSGRISAHLGNEPVVHPIRIQGITPALALAESFLF